MTDKYIYFKYKGISSLDYNAYIVNEGTDLRFSNAPAFTNEFAFPKFSNANVLLGVNKENREFSLKIILLNIKINKYREFLGWLNIESSGDLQFGYNLNYAYKVKVSNISEGTFFVIKDPNCSIDKMPYNIELDITFTTVGDWAAKWVGSQPYFNFNEMPFKEGFETHTISNTAYVSGWFYGATINGETIRWDYVGCRGESGYPITNKGVMLRRAQNNADPLIYSPSELFSNQIQGGIKNFSFDIRKGFIGATDRHIAVDVYDVTNDLTYTFEYGPYFGGDGENPTIIHIEEDLSPIIEGNFTIRFYVTSPLEADLLNRQIVVDNFIWSSLTAQIYSDLIDSESDSEILPPAFVTNFSRLSEGVVLVDFFNNHNIENYYKIEFSDSLRVEKDGVIFYEVFSGGGVINTQYGIGIKNGQFIPMNVNKGVLAIPPKQSLQLKFIVNNEEEFTVYPISRENI